jgi:hypothetical protein
MTQESLSGTREEFISVVSSRVLEGPPMGIMTLVRRFYTQRSQKGPRKDPKGRSERRKGFHSPTT